MKTSVYVNGARGRMGQSIGALVKADSSLAWQDDFESADVAIDFSAPGALLLLMQQCVQHRKPLVVGTTGHSPENQQALQETSHHIPILFSPNFSLGMAACIEAAQLIARHLKGRCQIDIIEAHHVQKKDKPSGTALALAKAIGKIETPIHSIRAGDIIGDHTILFTLEGERIELKHQAHSRAAFARGALAAAKFLKNQPPGLYSVKDIIHAAHQS